MGIVKAHVTGPSLWVTKMTTDNDGLCGATLKDSPTQNAPVLPKIPSITE